MKRTYNQDTAGSLGYSTDSEKINKAPKLYHVTIVQNVQNHYHNHHVVPADNNIQTQSAETQTEPQLQSHGQSSSLLLTQYNQQQRSVPANNHNHIPDYDGVLNWPETDFYAKNFLRL
jgi:hypothetical protein